MKKKQKGVLFMKLCV